MGTDIHVICEVKENGKWKKNEKRVFPDPDHYWLKKRLEEDPEYQVPDFWQDSLHNEFDIKPETGRNYDKFAILANVRNGRGFAGVKTGRGFAFMSDSRGFPEGVDSDYLEEYGDWTHSRTWINLEDIKNFDWEQMTYKNGVVSLEQYKKLRNPLVKHNTKTPDGWSGSISGRNIITISSEEAEQVLNGELTELTRINEWGEEKETTKPIDEWEIHVDYEWAVKYNEWFDHVIENWVEPIKKLGEEFEDVRVVMSFDS